MGRHFSEPHCANFVWADLATEFTRSLERNGRLSGGMICWLLEGRLSRNSRDRPQNAMRSAGTEELISIQVEREPAEEASDMEPITGVPGKPEGLRVVGARFCDLQISFHLKLLVYGDSKSSFYLPLLTPQFYLLLIVIPPH